MSERDGDTKEIEVAEMEVAAEHRVGVAIESPYVSKEHDVRKNFASVLQNLTSERERARERRWRREGEGEEGRGEREREKEREREREREEKLRAGWTGGESS